jgi:hypothetical protein
MNIGDTELTIAFSHSGQLRWRLGQGWRPGELFRVGCPWLRLTVWSRPRIYGVPQSAATDDAADAPESDVGTARLEPGVPMSKKAGKPKAGKSKAGKSKAGKSKAAKSKAGKSKAAVE